MSAQPGSAPNQVAQICPWAGAIGAGWTATHGVKHDILRLLKSFLGGREALGAKSM